MKGLLLKNVMTQRKSIITSILFCFGMGGFFILVMLSVYYGNFHEMLTEQDFWSEVFIRRTAYVLAFTLAILSSSIAGMAGVFREDMAADFGKVAVSLPVSISRRTMSVYVFYMGFLLLVFVCNLVVHPLFYKAAKVEITGKMFVLILAGFAINLFINLIDVPLVYRFGVRTAFVVNLALIIVCGIGSLRFMAEATDTSLHPEELVRSVDRLINGFALSVPGLLFVGVPLSFVASCSIQKRGRNQVW